MKRGAIALLAGLVVLAGAARAQDAYYDVPIRSLTLTEGGLPTGPQYEGANWRAFGAMVPYATLHGEGEVHVRSRGAERWTPWRGNAFFYDNANLAIRAPVGKDVTGQLCVPRPDGTGMDRLAFKVPASAASADARNAFYNAKQQHYEAFLQRRIPGGAWFRHQARIAREQRTDLKVEAPEGTRPARRPGRPGELEDTYAVFTGGRAISENLQLDRLLRPAGTGEATVDVASLPGITVQEMDWEPLIKDLKPQRDPLAVLIPADQHALFFPSFDAFMTMLDEAKAHGTPVLRLLEPRSEDARTHERYERQLCLSLNALSRLLGPQVINSVAFTGSDTYLRTGSDVALLYEAKDLAVLKGLIIARVGAGSGAVPEARLVQGEVEGVPYSGARSPDRAVCSYVATVGNAVVVTNSLHQLGRLVRVSKGQTPSLASLPEYTFMRGRYPRGDNEETAFLMVPDAAIRRWCGPRWRIAASRRTRAAAFMAELQARYLDDLVKGKAKGGTIEEQMPLPDGGELSLAAGGVRSSVYGDLEFMTPIAEMPLAKVTEAEAATYRRWNERYHRNWRQYFDPIAMRFTVAPGKIAADVTVMPLIEGSDYRETMEVTGEAEIAPDSGDPHAEALLHFAMAIDANSEPVREFGGFAVTMAPALGAQAMAWLGQSVALYADESPFWEDLKNNLDDANHFMQNNFHRLPVAFRAEVKDGLKLTVFLTALRAFVETSAPGMTVWEVLAYGGQPYVKVSASEEARRGVGEKLAVYYAALPEAFVLTLGEDVLKRALDRHAARREAQAEGKPIPRVGKPWLGGSMCLHGERRFLDLVRDLVDEQYRSAMRRRAWGNIPILNEWKRLYPDRDPLKVHQQVWTTRLVCPGGGTYVWNEEWQTMMSTAFGHPGGPKEGAMWPQAMLSILSGNLGVTFENQGLRARAVLERKAEGP